MSPLVSDAVLRFVRASDAFDADALDGIRYVVVQFGADRFLVVDVARIRDRDAAQTWGEIAKRHRAADKPGPAARVREPRVMRGRDGKLRVLAPLRPAPSGTRRRAKPIGHGGGDGGSFGIAGESGRLDRVRRGPFTLSGASAPSRPAAKKGPVKKAASKKTSPTKTASKKVPSKNAPAKKAVLETRSKTRPKPKAAASAESLSAASVATTFNAEFENHARRQPLPLNTPCVLAFYAGKPDANADAAVAGNVAFQQGERDAKLTIHLTGADFTIEQPSQDLIVKRDGTSRGRARFDLTPVKEGRCKLVATIVKEGNFVQRIDLDVNVGIGGKAIAKTKSAGRTFTSDETIKPRDLMLQVEQTPDGGIEIIATQRGHDAIRGHSDMNAAGLGDLVSDLRATLKELIENAFDDAAKKIAYTEAIEISPAVHAKALAKLAEESYAMFRSIFFEAGADAGMKEIGRLLASLAAGPPRDIQVVTSRFVIPWQLLYAAPALDPIESRHFLGFSHRIEHLALRSGWQIQEAKIDTADLRISVNINRGIDEEFGVTTVADQMKFFADLAASGKVKIEVRDTVAGVKSALADPQLVDQVIYLYCHAVSNSAGQGVGKSALLFEGKKQLTLSALRAAVAIDAPPFRGAPLVVINACQSAELSPVFYDGFVPHLTSRGARGVIGTECDTPAMFGATWGEAFFREFLEGGELGDVMLTLRRKFLEEKHNFLGLLYAVHCNGNTRVDPAMGLTAS